MHLTITIQTIAKQQQITITLVDQGASYSTTSNNVRVTTTAAPSSNGRSISNGYASGK